MIRRFVYMFDKMAVVFIFGLVIYIPFFLGLLQKDQISSAIEQRNLTKIPALPSSKNSIKNYPEAFNLYYADHFGLREQMTALYFSIMHSLGAQNSISNVTFGQDGWMFLGNIKPGSEKYMDPMGDAINKNLFSNQQLKEFADSIMAIKNWLKKKGIKYIYVIAPNKHTIYFDKMPKYISKQNKYSATDQLVAYLKEHTDVIVVDLRQALVEEKKKHQVYFKSDTHWTFYGANAAQFEMMKKVELLFPGQIKPKVLNDEQFVFQSKTDGDLTKYAKAGVVVEELALPVFDEKIGCQLVKENPGHSGVTPHTFLCANKTLNTVIFRDSFFNYLQTYIARYFRRSTYIMGKINYQALEKYVVQENPDIVIEEVVEREFPYLPTDEFVKTYLTQDFN